MKKWVVIGCCVLLFASYQITKVQEAALDANKQHERRHFEF